MSQLLLCCSVEA